MVYHVSCIQTREQTSSPELFAEMCKLLGIKKTRTTAYNPKSDGLVERFNRTLMNIIAMLVEEDTCDRDWDELLPYATSAYRSTPQESTGETPNMMMLGREVRLPIELTMPSFPVEEEVIGDFTEKLRENFQEAHKRAEQVTGKSARKQKKMYDRHTTETGLQENQFVWLFDPSKKKGVSPKLQLRWKGPFLIVSQLSDVTFRIQATTRSKPIVVHSDRLKPYRGQELPKWTWRKPSDPIVEESGEEEVPGNHEEEVPHNDEEGESEVEIHNNEVDSESDRESDTQLPFPPDLAPAGLDIDEEIHGITDSPVNNNRYSRYPGRNRRPPEYLRDFAANEIHYRKLLYFVLLKYRWRTKSSTTHWCVGSARNPTQANQNCLNTYENSMMWEVNKNNDVEAAHT